MSRPTLTAVFVAFLLTSSVAKPNAKDKKPKQVVPAIECDMRAGKINLPEFIVKCPAKCRETKEKVYGTGVFASISSICNAAIHNGVITNSGGKVIVMKMGGQATYKGSFANGVRSLSLPNWRDSFSVSVGKPKKGVIYPSTLIFVPSRPTAENTADHKDPPHSTVSPATEPSSTAAPPTTTHVTTPIATAPPITTSATPRVTVHKVREAVLDPRPDNTEYEQYGQYPPEPEDHKPLSETGHTKDCKVDIAFLMDGSWSIGKRRFKIQKDFLVDVSQVINVGVAGPMMGIIQYGDDPVTEFSLKQFSSSKDLKPAISKIVQKGGLSNVGKALSYINKNFFSDANGNRGGAPNVAVVLVDGWPTDKLEEASRLARESGINIFFVTIEGPDENEKQNVVETNFVEKAVCRTNGFFSLPITSWFALRKEVQSLVKRVCDTDHLVCSKTCLNANDIAFVIDGSSSVGTGNFRTVLQFVANVTQEFEISDTDTRVGIIQYTYEQRLEFAFGQHNNKADLLNAIKRINYWSGGTSTGAAITYAADQLFSKSKPNKRKIMIVITDGRSYDDVRAPALAVHHKGVIAYSIGIAWAAQDELEYIATDPDREHSFFVDEFDNLYKYVPKIIHNICNEFNSQPRN
ncbi:vitrin-like isoform X7 [Cyprinus carpio]|uniref:Cochlin n=1 Tax=Cyprinus carpio TaxID=7962 RepID=A0A9R0B6U9_CYPCA|nr:vitrin-like isoform X7 [Cyprinus carpio]